ncbi:MAG: 3-hydroxyacyl-CoA dehydrogenase NAD-binding domain-containing protein [Pseudomonadota bacterium]
MTDQLSPEVSLAIDGEIAVVMIDNPPVNASSQSVRAGLKAAAERIASDSAIKAAVIACAGRTFMAGADVREFGKPLLEPGLPDVIDQIEALDKPVVAAIHGTALGGGFELCLGCHYRLMAANAKVGLPEVNLGIIPGAGGTQRLPRLTDVESAVEMITAGRPIDAGRAEDLSIADDLTDTDTLVEDAVQFARSKIGFPVPRVSARDCPPAPDEGYFARQADTLTKKSRGQASPLRALDAVKIATETDYPNGARREREIFSELRASDQSKALRYMFFGERAVSKLPGLKSVAPRQVAKAGVIGGGTMGAGIATALLAGGIEVVMLEREQDALETGMTRVQGLLDGMAERGKLDDPETVRARFSGDIAYDAVADADLIVEAVFEDINVKRDVFARIDAVAKPGAVLATNTSYLDVNEIAAATSRPQDVIGLHFFSPAHIMKLLEIVIADKTVPDVVATGFALAKRLGKTGVRSGVCDGFIGNRILSAYRLHGDILLEEGATPKQIDDAMRGYGFAMGMYAVQDLAGLDISWANRKAKAGTRDPNARYVRIADRVCEAGRFGQKNGQGWFDYPDGPRKPMPSDAVQAVIDAERADRGITPRSFTSDEIMERLMLAMINEAAHILDEGIALAPVDVDVVKVHGYGFPRHKGGPMHQADVIGMHQVADQLDALAAEDPSAWIISPLIRKLAGEGRSFADLDVDAR